MKKGSPEKQPEMLRETENTGMIQMDGMIRVYIAITLLLLLLTVSQVCAWRISVMK